MNELVCQKHGPYDALYGTCPICSGASNLPPAPDPLMEDDMPTDLGGGQFPEGYGEDESPTELGAKRKQAAGYPGVEDEDPTEIGVEGRFVDVTEVEFEETGLLGILWVKEGPRRGRIHKIKDGTVIGRSDGDVILDDPKVSNPHARFRLEDDQFEIWDFGSRNGTFVNDNNNRIREATKLSENDEIKIGDTVFVFKVLI